MGVVDEEAAASSAVGDAVNGPPKADGALFLPPGFMGGEKASGAYCRLGSTNVGYRSSLRSTRVVGDSNSEVAASWSRQVLSSPGASQRRGNDRRKRGILLRLACSAVCLMALGFAILLLHTAKTLASRRQVPAGSPWAAHVKRESVLRVAAFRLTWPMHRLCIAVGRCKWPPVPPPQLPRDSLPAIHGAGSIFGFVKYKLNCPAAPTYTLRPLWENSTQLLGPHSQPAHPEDAKITLLIGVLSSCTAAEARTAVRDTWFRLSTPEGQTWRAVFIVSSSCRGDLATEEEAHNDIHFVPVKDSYFTLTRKVMLFFDYAHSVGAEYTLKTDDDSYVFTDRVLAELQRLPRSCLYWGQANRLPPARQYKASALSVPLHKWYIPKTHYVTMLEQTVYMQGGGYLLSRDLVERVAQRKEEPPAHLPEDAVMARMIGTETTEACMCSDLRMVKSATDFQGVDLFANTTKECELSDIAHRVLNVHGIRTPEDMRSFHAAGIQPLQQCDLNGRMFSGPEYKQLWGYQRLPPRPLMRTREATIWKKLQMRSKRTLHPGLVPMAILLGNSQLEAKLPWCMRMHWATQVIDRLKELSDANTLLCNLVRSNWFVNATTLDVWLDEGNIRLKYANESRLHNGKWCFSHELCQTCFLHASREFLDDGRCDLETHKCVGYDGASQAKVVVNKLLRYMFASKHFPAVPKRKFLTQVSGVLEKVFVKRHPLQPQAQDWVVDRLHNDWQGLVMAYSPRVRTCIAGNISPVRELMQSVAEGLARPEEPEATGEEDTDVDETAEKESAEERR